MRVTISILAITLVAFLGAFLYLTLNRYPSAFEADQACHYAEYSLADTQSDLGCDHDLETRQWILFREGLKHQPSQVLQRFRY